MKDTRAAETTFISGKGNGEIQKSEVDAEYHRLMQKAIAQLSGERNARIVSAVIAEARKMVGKELQIEIGNGYTRQYQILDFVRARLDSDLEQARRNIIPSGVHFFFGATSAPDDERKWISRKRRDVEGDSDQ